MNFLSGHMDYNMGSTLTFKCNFCYDFISIYDRSWRNKYGFEKNLQQKL